MPSHTPAKKKAAKKRKSMLRKMFDLAIEGKLPKGDRVGNIQANKQLKELEKENR